MEDFGFGGDEFLMGDCMDDWHADEGGWDDFEARECFQEQCAEEAEGSPFAEAWRDTFDEYRESMEW